MTEECPVCGFKLKGNRFAGFECLKCHAHYSARFVAHMRRQTFKHIIKQHFEKTEHPQPISEVQERVLIPDNGEVEKILNETKHAIQKATEHLEKIELDVPMQKFDMPVPALKTNPRGRVVHKKKLVKKRR